MTDDPRSGIDIPGTSSYFLDPAGAGEGRLRYLTGGTGAPLVLLHTVRTQAEHFRGLIPLVHQRYTVYALDLPGMGYSQIVPGASYEEPAMRAAVKRLLTHPDLRDVTLLGESMGAVLALTTAADLPQRVRRVVAINPYDYAGGIARSSLLARLIVTGVLVPGVGRVFARLEPRPVMRAVLKGGLGDTTALQADYLDELLQVGRRPSYSTVARAVYGNLPSLIAARSRYPEVSAPVDLIYGERDWSRRSDREANRHLLPAAEFTEVPNAGHFIALERPDVPADLLNESVGRVDTGVGRTCPSGPHRSAARLGAMPGVAELSQHQTVRAWFAGAHHDELPAADQQRYLAALDEFLTAVGKSPEELVAFCFLDPTTREKVPAQKDRLTINEWIDECVQGNGRTGKDAVRVANVVRGFLIHNGVLLQGPAWTKGML